MDNPFNIEDADYVVHRGQYYDVVRNYYNDEAYLVEIDEIPEEYWQRWEGENDA